MAPRELDSDVWAVVLCHLYRPPPAPCSAPPRSAIRQPDLCNAARVCRLFSSLVDPILYSFIITDDLAATLANALLPSMRRRFAMCRTLHIEYRQNGQDAPYFALIKEGRQEWQRVGRSAEELEEAVMEDVQAEVRGLFRALRKVFEADGEPIFPRVEHVAVAALYSEQDPSFTRYLNKSAIRSEERQFFHAVTVIFDQFLSRLPQIRAICLRSVEGPLAIGTVPPESQIIPPIIRTLHFGTSLDTLYLDPGVPLRLVSDAPPNADWTDLIGKLKRAFRIRQPTRAPDVRGQFGTATMDVEIYCSTASETITQAGKAVRYPCTPELQREKAAELGDELQRLYRETSGVASSGSRVATRPPARHAAREFRSSVGRGERVTRDW